MRILIALILFASPAFAQNGIGYNYRPPKMTAEEQKRLECFQNAPWVPKPDWLERCMATVKK